MSVNVFRFFRPPGEEGEDRSEKRRAQVRRAQQTYRLRKDQYVRALEREVTRLRSIEATLSKDNERLREVVGAQKRLLAEKRTWGNFWDGLSGGDDVFGESTLSDCNPPLGIGAHTPALSCPNTSPSCRTDGCQVSPAAGTTGDQASTIAFIPPFDSFDAVSSQCNPSDLTAAGMEFVLALESPCLSHIHAHTDDSTTSVQHQIKESNTDIEGPRVNGHALTASSYILSLSSSSPPAPAPAPATTATPTHDLPSDDDALAAAKKAAIVMGVQSTPNGILDRLLTLATSFALEDEITPVQAWERLRPLVEEGNPRMESGNVSREVVRTLVGRLAGVVRCYGLVPVVFVYTPFMGAFGAVVKKEAFEQALSEVSLGW
ncbi:hypothetical protein OQA88_10897 [Cercophora sp. LCS_1]